MTRFLKKSSIKNAINNVSKSIVVPILRARKAPNCLGKKKQEKLFQTKLTKTRTRTSPKTRANQK